MCLWNLFINYYECLNEYNSFFAITICICLKSITNECHSLIQEKLFDWFLWQRLRDSRSNNLRPNKKINNHNVHETSFTNKSNWNCVKDIWRWQTSHAVNKLPDNKAWITFYLTVANSVKIRRESAPMETQNENDNKGIVVPWICSNR